MLPVPGHPGVRNYSERTAQSIDEAVREIVAESFDRALTVLTKHRATLEEAAAQLLEHETMSEAELRIYAEQIAGRVVTVPPGIENSGNDK